MAGRNQGFALAALKRKVAARDELIRYLMRTGEAGPLQVGDLTWTFDRLVQTTASDEQRKLLAEIMADGSA